MFSDRILELAEALRVEYGAAGRMIATAESCTGGLIAGAITEIAGSSAVFDRGFVTYTNEAKEAMLGVPKALLDSVGAVSAEVAEAMAKGALAASGADVAVAVTGIAGPGGATATKPVGRVYIGVAVRDGTAEAREHTFAGDRHAVRMQTVEGALERLRDALT